MPGKHQSWKAYWMTVCKNEIWLANLNPQKHANEVGKVRPVVVIQNDMLNRTDYPTVIVLPLTTDLIDDAEPLRMRLVKRDKVMKDSDVLVAQMRAVDRSRLLERLGVLTTEESEKLRQLVFEILD